MAVFPKRHPHLKQNDYLTIPKSKQATHIHLAGYLRKNALCVSVISS